MDVFTERHPGGRRRRRHQRDIWALQIFPYWQYVRVIFRKGCWMAVRLGAYICPWVSICCRAVFAYSSISLICFIAHVHICFHSPRTSVWGHPCCGDPRGPDLHRVRHEGNADILSSWFPGEPCQFPLDVFYSFLSSLQYWFFADQSLVIHSYQSWVYISLAESIIHCSSL